jgi:molybdopterin synthase sulfur carrier subunit
MIKVLFFARLREQLGESSLCLTPEEAGRTVSELLDRLRRRGESWAAALGTENLLCAVNQEQAHGGETIADGDEIAFFPPVTGG